MKLSPPITILALICAALAAVALKNNIGPCAYGPEGNVRWSAFSDWFVDIDDRDPAANCDVWADISPRKPIEIIEILDGSSALQIAPDGTVKVSLFAWGVGPGYFDDGDVPNYDANQPSANRRVLIGRAAPNVYSKVRSLIAPMRDFTAYLEQNQTQPSFLTMQPQSPQAQRFWHDVYYDLDDPRTRFGRCRQPICDGGAGWTVLFWDQGSKSFQSLSTYHHIGCNDVAAFGGAKRVNEAADLIASSVSVKSALDAHRKANIRYRP